MPKKKSPKSQNEELPEMPTRDEVGQAAHIVILAENNLADHELALEIARKNLLKVMAAHGRTSVAIEGRKFTRRFYQSKETIVVSKAR